MLICFIFSSLCDSIDTNHDGKIETSELTHHMENVVRSFKAFDPAFKLAPGPDGLRVCLLWGHTREFVERQGRGKRRRRGREMERHAVTRWGRGEEGEGAEGALRS